MQSKPTSRRGTKSRQSSSFRAMTPTWLSIGAVVGIAVISTTTTSFTMPPYLHQTNTPVRTIASRSENTLQKQDLHDRSFRNLFAENPSAVNGEVCNGDEPQDTYEIHVGRALDRLRDDYPLILTDSPEFSIYDESIEIVDPTGVKLHGITNYKNVFRLLHAIVNVFYCPERSGLTFRLCYDAARHNIRVQWNAEVIPKAIFGGVRSTLHADGISIYEIDRASGLITQHRLERLLINDIPIKPKIGVFAALQNEHQESLPVYSTGVGSLDMTKTSRSQNEFIQFQESNSRGDVMPLSMPTTSTESGAGETAGDSGAVELQIDWEAMERKNASRKKFGLKPLSPEEYLKMDEEIKQMDSQQRQRAAASAQAAAEIAAKKEKENRPGFMDKVFGSVFKDTCESNFDCERPEICCDFGVKKMCCASGMRVWDGAPNLQPQRAMVPVPVEPSPPDYGPNGYPKNY